MSKPSLNPQHVLIIGAGAGPGLSASVARRFGREGYTVTLVARNAEKLATPAEQLRRRHHRRHRYRRRRGLPRLPRRP